MCMSFRIDPKEMADILTNVRKMKLANDIFVNLGRSLIMYGDMYPSEIVPVLAPNKSGNMSFFPMVWGFTHGTSTKPIINCRVETAASRAMWRESWHRRRCIIPASWYYEWGYPVYDDDSRSIIENRSTKKLKYAIQAEGSTITYIAGLYRYEEHGGMLVTVFSVLTREAVGTVKDIHDRMPLILDKKDLRDWICPSKNPSLIAAKALTNLIAEKAVEYHRSPTEYITA